MGPTLRRVTATLLSSFTAVLLAVPAGAHASPATEAKLAAGYLASVQQANGSIVAFSAIGSTADAVSAFVAAGVGTGAVGAALKYLRKKVAAGKVRGIGLEGKVVLAVSASGGDPRTFGGVDLVHKLRSSLGPDGRFGTAAVLDDALAALALRSAGMAVPASASSWLVTAQCPDGGWAYDQPYNSATDDADCYDGTQSDVFPADSNTTSYVVQALEAAHVTGWTADPFAFFHTVRDPVHGGWSYSSAFLSTDANSTSLVLQAYDAAGKPIPPGGLRALRNLQHTGCGAFAYAWDGSALGDPDVGATIGAVPALVGKAFPVTGTLAGEAPSVPPCG